MKKLFLLFVSCFISASMVTGATAIVIDDVEKQYVISQVQNVDGELKEQFEKLHSEWYDAAKSNPDIHFSDTMYDRCKLPQYQQLVDMGQAIVPLLMEKLMDDRYFFSQIIYEAIIQDSKMLPSIKTDKGCQTGQSSQDRAKQIVKLWASKAKSQNNK